MTSSNSNTIYLTPAEDERFRAKFKGRVQKCRELAGQPREPVDPPDAFRQVTSASFMADLSGVPDEFTANPSQQNDVVAFSVGTTYPPSTVPLQDLQPMKLSQLRMETHHRGRMLALRRTAEVLVLRAWSWSMLQEEDSEEIVRIETFLHKARHGEDILESASNFWLKEPYFTLSDQGEPTLRVDHPSDLIVRPGNGKLHEKGGDSNGAAPAAKTATKCKEEGNAALKQRSYLQAHVSYTEGLKLTIQDGAPKEDIARDLCRNRAHVNNLLSRFDEAWADGIAAVTGKEDQKHKDLDSKAYFRAGCAALSLGQYEEAKALFQSQLKLAPGDKDAAISLRKIESRLREQAAGSYDFWKIKAALSKAHPRTDAADFIDNTTVKESPGAGRGLFATRDIDAGKIVICEKAFCVVWGHEPEAWTAMSYDVRDDRLRVVPADLCRAVVQKLLSNPSKIPQVMDLFGDYPGLGNRILTLDGSPVIDTFQIHDIVSRNAFGISDYYGEENVRKVSPGLWVRAAYANHSCIPNAEKEYIGDLMILRALNPIRAGEEITHSYDAHTDYDARQASLMNTWSFTCTCPLCVAEKADDQAVRKKRARLEAEAEVLMARDEPGRAKRLAVVKLERLAREINGTYEDGRFQGVPRTALSGVQRWLAIAKAR